MNSINELNPNQLQPGLTTKTAVQPSKQEPDIVGSQVATQGGEKAELSALEKRRHIMEEFEKLPDVREEIIVQAKKEKWAEDPNWPSAADLDSLLQDPGLTKTILSASNEAPPVA